MKNTDFTRSLFELYDEMTEAYQRMNRNDFTKQLSVRCSKFKESYPECSEYIVGMMLHFQNKK